MTIFYYLLAPFILIALALLPISYGAWIGWQAGSRPKMALPLHLVLGGAMLLCLGMAYCANRLARYLARKPGR